MAQMLLRASRLGIGLPVKGGDHGERLRRNWTCSEGCGGTLTERSSRDVSIGYFAILAIGSTLWASYGVSLGNLAILIPNVVAFLADIATMLVAHRLRPQEQLNVPGCRDGDDDELAPTRRQAEWQPAKQDARLSFLTLTAREGCVLCTDHSRVRFVAERNCIFSPALGRLRRHPEEPFP